MFVAVSLIAVLAEAVQAPAVVAEGASAIAAAGEDRKNVIVMISDGCGFAHVEATDYYQYGALGKQVYEGEAFEHLAMSTYPDGGSYSPDSMWGAFEACKEGATDSAAAATAMATGVKTYKAAIGVGPNKEKLLTVVEAAEAAGRATGVITDVPLSHATPAGFVAHNEDRDEFAAIAREMFLESGLDVVMGSGHPWYGADGEFAPALPEGEDLKKALDRKYEKVGGLETWAALLTGNAANDADNDGEADPWTLITSREGFQRLARGENVPKRVAGVFESVSTTQQGRSGVDDNVKDDLPYQTPRIESVPTLAEMTTGALNVLGADPDGFFLMVEGGAIDWASHGNQLGRMIEEQIDFNEAVEAAVQWVDAHVGWENTLLVITADHECGYLCGTGSNPEWKPVVNNGKGNLPGAEWFSGGHTNQLVPFYARGAGSEFLIERADQEDPARGRYLDNAELGQVIKALMK